MIWLYNDKKDKLGLLKHASELHIHQALKNGDETLFFEYPKSGPHCAKIQTEGYARTEFQEYVIKEIDTESSKDVISVTAQLNLEELEGRQFVGGFETVEMTLTQCLSFALQGTGWSLRPCKITKKRTVRIEQDCNTWGVIKQALSTYRGEVAFHTLTREVEVVQALGENKGVYFVEGLNLRKLGVTKSSYGFFTRIIPVGKDGIQLWVNGQNYIDNHQYTDKVITAIWRDERYTNTTSLYDDALAKLAEASKPVNAYSADVKNLASLSEQYSVLDYKIGDTVLLASRKTEVMERQRIVALDRWPKTPSKNTVELCNVTQTFAELQKTEAETAKQEAIDVSQRLVNETLREGYLTKVQTETAIRAMGDSIELYVAETYFTKDETEIKISSTMQQTKDAINMTFINGKLSANTQFDINGITVRNGGIKIYNNSGDLTFFSDTEGNTYCARLGGDRYKNFYAEIGSTDYDGRSWQGLFGYYRPAGTDTPVFMLHPIHDSSLDQYGAILQARDQISVSLKNALSTNVYLTHNRAQLVRRGDSIILTDGKVNLISDNGDILLYTRSKAIAKFGDAATYIWGDFACSGTKNRLVKTENHGVIALNAYETMGCWFGDIGEGVLDEDGVCFIHIDDRLLESLTKGAKYQVFLQGYGDGSLHVESREETFFVVHGTPNMCFAWEIKGKQSGYEADYGEQSFLPADFWESPDTQPDYTGEFQMDVTSNFAEETSEFEKTIAETYTQYFNELGA